jgi:hypothetical protein
MFPAIINQASDMIVIGRKLPTRLGVKLDVLVDDRD